MKGNLNTPWWEWVVNALLLAAMLVTFVANILYDYADAPLWVELVVPFGVGAAFGTALGRLIVAIMRERRWRRTSKFPAGLELHRDDLGWTMLATTVDGDATTIRLPEEFDDYDPNSDRGRAAFEYAVQTLTGLRPKLEE